jgi:hypothetical protein
VAWRTPRRESTPALAGTGCRPPANWIGDAATRFVYDSPAVLWRSARAILAAQSIVTPDNIRDLVELPTTK